VKRRHFLGLGAAGLVGWIFGFRPWDSLNSPDHALKTAGMSSTDASPRRDEPTSQDLPASESFAQAGPSDTTGSSAGAEEDRREPTHIDEPSDDTFRPSQSEEVPPERSTPEVSAGDAHADKQHQAIEAEIIEVICRDALGLAAAVPAGAPHTIHTLTLHHTELRLEHNALAPVRLRRHQRYHLQQGWGDIAYHYGIDLAGNIYELRDPATAGDTFTSYDPTGHLLVVCEGDFNHQQPTDALMDSVYRLVAFVASTHDVSITTLAGHRDYTVQTTCPGDNLQRELGNIRREATRLRREFSFDVTMLCGSEGRRRIEAISAGRGE
jgi:hypothetical protein